MERNDYKKIIFSIVGVMLLMGVIGGTYAFFNYTRTGVSNTIRVGRISFTSSQTETINLTNVFPINRNNVSTDTTNTDDVVITIEGDTEYSDGVEYLVTATDVTNTVNNKPVPISINVTVGNGLGTSNSSYFTNRGTSASTHIYKVLEDEVSYDNQELLVGYIKSSSTGINGTITIRAFLDEDRIGISDTYNGSASNNMGTTDEWARGRSILTTTEWNSLQSSGVSFKIKVEANEGIWVEGPIPTIDTCPGCKYIFSTTNVYYYRGNNQSTIADIEANNDILTDDYRILNSNIFIGLKLENDTIVKAYACGIKSANPNIGKAFCIEGSNSRSLGLANAEFIEGPDLWNDPGGLLGRCRENIHGNEFYISCRGDDEVIAYSDSAGLAGVENNDYYCDAEDSGRIICR